ncbi:endonuclease I [Kipferlia bialata]|uniref:Endonuclease I n=1 Tax=Kipferlia bialata TaxID=797122 RepID=A0A9K3GES3_9EUKA|nr:endonuclease I [Kipferlia bialata]|eukprot:g765.t1
MVFSLPISNSPQEYYVDKHQSLDYEVARQYMYGYIDNHDGHVTGLYTGLDMPYPYGCEDTLYNTDIKCEHMIPQSFFGKHEPMRSDVHHLRPSYMMANSARSNYPYDVIADKDAYKWYQQRTVTTVSPPEAERDDWSRVQKGYAWYPEAAARGTVARGVLYLYTMYPKYIHGMHNVGDVSMFVDWCEEYPSTQMDMDRNDSAEQYQGNRNPYVDDNTLCRRAYADMI